MRQTERDVVQLMRLRALPLGRQVSVTPGSRCDSQTKSERVDREFRALVEQYEQGRNDFDAMLHRHGLTREQLERQAEKFLDQQPDGKRLRAQIEERTNAIATSRLPQQRQAIQATPIRAGMLRA